jgi:hypothetical protein
MAVNEIDQLQRDYPTMFNDLKAWDKYYRWYGAGHYIILGTGILAGIAVSVSSGSAAVTENIPFFNPIWTTILAALATAAVAITNLLDTGTKYKNYNKAWVVLSKAIMDHKADPEHCTAKSCIDAWATAQNIISDSPISAVPHSPGL